MRKTIQAAKLALPALRIASSLAASATLSAQAAEMSPPPLYAQDTAPLAELGSGWYLRGNVGYNELHMNTAYGGVSSPLFGASIGPGFQFNPYFRVDATYSGLGPLTKSRTIALPGTGAAASLPAPGPGHLPLGCPVAADTNNPGQVFTTSCTANPWEKLQASAWLLNFYIDLGNWSGFTPYFGAGVGASYLLTSSNIDYKFMSGVPYGTGGHNNYCGFQGGLGGLPCYYLGYPNDRGPGGLTINFAYALMAGVAIDVAPHVKLDLGYRLLNLGSSVTTQEASAGLRFTPDL
jgi:opacity protein-like surface antigen